MTINLVKFPEKESYGDFIRKADGKIYFQKEVIGYKQTGEDELSFMLENTKCDDNDFPMKYKLEPNDINALKFFLNKSCKKFK